MLFDVFVGSNGQLMMKTIAGMVSELTTGPETKEFLQAVLGMTSLFSRYDDDFFKPLSVKSTRVFQSLRNNPVSIDFHVRIFLGIKMIPLERKFHENLKNEY